MPALLEHETLSEGTEMKMFKGTTELPTLLTEADLIELMDKHGIGTDATMHEHIHTIQSRNYAVHTPQGYFNPSLLGVALVKGYKNFASQGLDLTKPDLRANMEADMAKVAAGILQKEDVLRSFITEMKVVFHFVSSNLHLLDNEIGQHFQPMGTSAAQSGSVVSANFTKCGKCGGTMTLKNAAGASRQASRGGRGAAAPRQERFLVCNKRQDGCDTLLHLPPRGDITPHQAICALCNFQVVSLTNSETKKSHTVCPYCFRHPPPAEYHVQSMRGDGDGIRAPGFGDFRCFMCSHATCPLANRRDP
eukprot:Selendium_serpulae@DN9209_c0_g1_i1.p1